MKKILILKLLICIMAFGGFLFAYIGQQNEVTKMRIELPGLAKECLVLGEENTRLKYDLERFENPKHLMNLAKRPEFSHLKHPFLDEILVLNREELPLTEKEPEIATYKTPAIYPRVWIGAHMHSSIH